MPRKNGGSGPRCVALVGPYGSGKTTLLALLDTGLGVFEFELRQVFFLLKLHESQHLAQLFFNQMVFVPELHSPWVGDSRHDKAAWL